MQRRCGNPAVVDENSDDDFKEKVQPHSSSSSRGSSGKRKKRRRVDTVDARGVHDRRIPLLETPSARVNQAPREHTPQTMGGTPTQSVPGGVVEPWGDGDRRRHTRLGTEVLDVVQPPQHALIVGAALADISAGDGDGTANGVDVDEVDYTGRAPEFGGSPACADAVALSTPSSRQQLRAPNPAPTALYPDDQEGAFGSQDFDGSPPSSLDDSAVMAEATPEVAPTYCPCCQANLGALDVAAAELHVDHCASTFSASALPCPKGGACASIVEKHFRAFSHYALATLRSESHATPTKPLSLAAVGTRTIDTYFSGSVTTLPRARAPRPPRTSRPTRPPRGMATDAGSKGKRPKRECPFYKRIPTTSITVDAFQFGAVPDCSAYFLTHFHTDHYGGLTAKFKGKVYCSEGTAALVAGMLKLPRSQIFPLSMETPTMVAGTECTLLDANHCPGSVLILFKLRDGRIILHTGDFRATSSMPNHPLLRDVSIHTLYLDTTYLDPKYCFPLQEECTERVIVETRQFLVNNPTALILVGTYSIGKERVFLALAKALGWKACVDRRKLAMLKAVMPHALPQLTLDGTLTRLHIVPMSSLSKVKIAKYTSERLRGIPAFSGVLAWRPTGWTHTWGSASKGAGATATKGSVDVRGVDYSEHSSYAELRNFVQSTQPTKIIPTVNNGSAEKRAEMSAAFRTWLGRSV